MPFLFNHDHQAAIVDHGETAVLPGESHEFSDEEVEAGIAGSWSSTPPVADETAKKDRAKRPDPAQNVEAPQIPAEAGEQKEF